MTKEIIDEFMENSEEIKNRIKVISANYTINDFILFSNKTREYFKNFKICDCSILYGCIFDLRDRYLHVDTDSVESRLMKEYMELLSELLETDNNIDIVFYIVAYHYLALCKEIAYKLMIKDNAPFHSIGQELSPLAKKRLNKYKDFYNEFYCLVDFFDEKDLEFYNAIFGKLIYHHHSVKHFSLLNYFFNMNIKISRSDFDDSFVNLLELYIFRYRAIYTEERLFAYMRSEIKEKIINGLMSIEGDPWLGK